MTKIQIVFAVGVLMTLVLGLITGYAIWFSGFLVGAGAAWLLRGFEASEARLK